MYKHLVLSGGGINGLAFISAYKELKDKLQLESITGVSVGCIFGMMITAGYSADEMESIILEKEMYELKSITMNNLFTNYGIDSGKNIMKYLAELLSQKGFHSNITLKQFYNYTKIHLKIIVTNLTCNTLQVIDYIDNPDLLLLTALRMSISVPFIFTHVKYKNNIYIDGCIIENYPIHLYKDKLDETIGLRLVENIKRNDINNFQDYITSICKILLCTNNYTEYIDNTINIEIDRDKAMNFSLTRKDKEDLLKIGKLAVHDFYKTSKYS